MKKAFIRLLSAAGIDFLRILWCDNAGIIRGKSVHADSLINHLEHGVGISPAQQSVPVMYDGISDGSGLSPVGEVRLVPDWDTFSILPYAPGHASVMGNMQQQGKPWPYCPREFLKSMIKKAGDEGLSFLASFENEFYLLEKSRGENSPVDNTPFASAFAMDANCHVAGKIVKALSARGMKIVQYYPESGPGQQEITVGCEEPLQAADNQIAFRETVRAVAFGEGLQASFLPKIFIDKSGSGCHLHFSLWKEDRSAFADPAGKFGLSQTGAAFIGGILHHLPSLMAVTTPTTNSFRRIKPHFWSGAFRCWGLDNREAAVRVITDPQRGLPDHFELKTSDATSNPYLALGCVIAAGLDGIRKGISPGEPMNQDPGNLSSQELSTAGTEPLPSDMGDAIDRLAHDRVILDAMGQELSTAYLAVKRNEYEFTRHMKFEEEVRLLIDRY